MKLTIRILTLFTIIFCAGCATIITGGSQTVSFDSSPQGAIVNVNGKVVGKTPMSISLDKGKNKTVVFKLKGHQAVSRQLSTSVQPWFWGNILTGGLFGSTTDFASGAVYEYSPNHYFVTLPPKENLKGVLSHSQRVEQYVVGNFHELRSAAAKGNPLENDVFIGLTKMLDIAPGENDKIDDLANTLLKADSPVDAAQRVNEKFMQQ